MKNCPMDLESPTDLSSTWGEQLSRLKVSRSRIRFTNDEVWPFEFIIYRVEAFMKKSTPLDINSILPENSLTWGVQSGNHRLCSSSKTTAHVALSSSIKTQKPSRSATLNFFVARTNTRTASKKWPCSLQCTLFQDTAKSKSICVTVKR